jgi:hypothetical protein
MALVSNITRRIFKGTIKVRDFIFISPHFLNADTAYHPAPQKIEEIF